MWDLILQALVFFGTTIETAVRQPLRELEIQMSQTYHDNPNLVSTYVSSVGSICSMLVLFMVILVLTRFPSNHMRSWWFVGIFVKYCLLWSKILYFILSGKLIEEKTYLSFSLLENLFGSYVLQQYLVFEIIVNNNCIEKVHESFYRQQMAKFTSKLLTQIILPTIIDEKIQVEIVAGCGIIGFAVCVIVLLREARKEQRETDEHVSVPRDETEAEQRENSIPTPSRWLLVPALLVFSFYWAQSCEYHYNYLFLRNMGLTQAQLRRYDGLQYIGFAIILALITSFPRYNPKWLVLIGGLCISIIGRSFQILAFYRSSLVIWLISTCLSLLCPGAGEVIRANVYAIGKKAQTNKPHPYVGMLAIGARMISVSFFTWVYYWSPCPFFVTEGLIIATLIGVLVFKFYK